MKTLIIRSLGFDYFDVDCIKYGEFFLSWVNEFTRDGVSIEDALVHTNKDGEIVSIPSYTLDRIRAEKEKLNKKENFRYNLSDL